VGSCMGQIQRSMMQKPRGPGWWIFARRGILLVFKCARRDSNPQICLGFSDLKSAAVASFATSAFDALPFTGRGIGLCGSAWAMKAPYFANIQAWTARHRRRRAKIGDGDESNSYVMGTVWDSFR
jgi:hypothetical protein